MKNKQEMNLRLYTAVGMAGAGLLLLFAALAIPPCGVIDTSVLVAFGEVLTFVGGLFGIDYVHRVRYEEKNHE